MYTCNLDSGVLPPSFRFELTNTMLAARSEANHKPSATVLGLPYFAADLPARTRAPCGRGKEVGGMDFGDGIAAREYQTGSDVITGF
ncbi:hypothetical protein HBI56_206100 [Parastagonospora nodorum]|nr:hypothetical protein HBI56_206100 [Parastagonospora nodorum]